MELSAYPTPNTDYQVLTKIYPTLEPTLYPTLNFIWHHGWREKWIAKSEKFASAGKR